MNILDKLQKPVYGTVGLRLASYLEPFAYRRHVCGRSLFHRDYSCSLELAELVSLHYFSGWPTRYSNSRLHDFSITILKCYEDVYISSFFPRKEESGNICPRNIFV